MKEKRLEGKGMKQRLSFLMAVAMVVTSLTIMPMEVKAAQAEAGWTTDSNGIMEYTKLEYGDNTYTFRGCIDGKWKQIMCDDEPVVIRTYGGNNITCSAIPVFTDDGQLGFQYKVKNDDSQSQKTTFYIFADTAVNGDDASLNKARRNHTVLTMQSGDVYFSLTSQDPGFYVKSIYLFDIGDHFIDAPEKEENNPDSAFVAYWPEVTLAPGEEKTYSVTYNATKVHYHGNWTYNLIGKDTIEATCGATEIPCILPDRKVLLKLTTSDMEYSGELYSGTKIEGKEDFQFESGASISEVKYYKSYTDENTNVLTTAENSGAVSDGGAPKNIGSYQAVIVMTPKNESQQLLEDQKLNIVASFRITEHSHVWRYKASGSKLTAICSADNDCTVSGGKDPGVTLTLNAPTSPIYSGNVATVTLSGTTAWKAALGDDKVPTINYVGCNGTNYDSVTAPTAVGEYIAKISPVGVDAEDANTAKVDFKILPLTPRTTACVLHFDSQGGSQVDDMEVDYGKTASLPYPTRTSYEFQGWFTGTGGTGVLYTNNTVITTSATLYANWGTNTTTPGAIQVIPSTSGSSSSSSSSETKPKAQAVVVDGKKYDIATQKVSGNETSLTVDQSKFVSYIDKAEKGSDVVIPVTSNTDKIKAQLNLQNVKDMSDKSMTLKVENQKVTYTIPANAIDTSAVANKLGIESLKDIPVEIILEKADRKTIKDAEAALKGQNSEMIGTPMTFEIKASANGKEVEIQSFNTYIKNSLEVTEKEAEAITTAVIILPDGSMIQVPTKLSTKDGKQIVDINSKTNGTYVLVKNNVSYSDAQGKWYESVANELGSRMITKCLDKANTNTIQGEKAITREEFAALLVNALGLPQTTDATQIFSDVKAGSSYANEIGAAYEYGLINGVTETSFAPSKTITRQEAMVMLQRASQVAELKGQEAATTTSFKDASKVSSWAKEAVAFNVGNGLIVGSNGKLEPQATITRAESMTAVLRMLQKAELIDVRTEA